MTVRASVFRCWPRQQLGLGDRRERQVCGRGARPCYRHVTGNMILSPFVVLSAEPSAERSAQRNFGSLTGSSPPSAAELVGRSRKWSSGRGGCAWSSATVAHDDPAPLMTAEARPRGALGPTLRERGCVSRDIAARGLDTFLQVRGPIVSWPAPTIARTNAPKARALRPRSPIERASSRIEGKTDCTRTPTLGD